jgi:hypothetical protein
MAVAIIVLSNPVSVVLAGNVGSEQGLKPSNETSETFRGARYSLRREHDDMTG